MKTGPNDTVRGAVLILAVWPLSVWPLSVWPLVASAAPVAVPEGAFAAVDAELALLGRDLFFDPVLSGNRNIACATCHHPRMGGTDAMSLGLGEGATGLGPARAPLPKQTPTARIARNAPALWNLGATEFTVMFHDGRVAADPAAPSGFRMPTGRALPGPVASALAAQAVLPVIAADEMAGQPGENPIADAVAIEHVQGDAGAWALIATRVAEVPDYAARFAAVTGSAADITGIANALAAFIATEFRADDSPWDRHLAGEVGAISAAAQRGADLFHGHAGCATCHAGPFQTDHGFHAIGMPQLGPGKSTGGDRPLYSDPGRLLVTGDADDRYRFRTPSLRMVAETGPWGHAGAYTTLEAAVRHHLDPIGALMAYDRAQARLHAVDLGPDAVPDWAALDDQEELLNIAEAVELPPLRLSDAEVADILAFLAALTDKGALNGRLAIPDTVPSRLPVDR